jgi:hypothetical protein
MPTPRQQKQQQDLGIRLEQLKSLFTLIQQEIKQLSSRGELAPLLRLDCALPSLHDEEGLIGIISGNLTQLFLLPKMGKNLAISILGKPGVQLT